ncbi:MAG: SDR family oxidoreductase [Acidimicrobiales bacterium]|nr:SDR family oxidoreductase [Acidimicrobiales bacterium]
MDSTAPTDLDGHVVVVTGATRGIGRGIAHHIGKLGTRVVVTGRKQDRLDAAAAELADLGIAHLAFQGDVADVATNGRIVAAAVGEFGRLDGIVANAQSFRPVTPLEDVTESDMDLLLNTGPKATLWLMQAALPHFTAAKRGRIVTMGTAMGLTGAPGYGPYAASNEAIRSLTRTAAREWGRNGVTVNCVLPASGQHRLPPAGSDPDREAAFAAMYEDHPLGRDGDAEHDIAPVVAFLLSDASQYVTGQSLMADGGGLMRA